VSEEPDHYVYVIGTLLNGAVRATVKVGISANPAGRISSIRTCCPNKIEFAHVFCLPAKFMARDLEAEFHQVFAKRVLNGEWFDMSPYEAVFVICRAIRDNLAGIYGPDAKVDGILERAGVLRAEAVMSELQGGETLQ
jgi:hypothetical protein